MKKYRYAVSVGEDTDREDRYETKQEALRAFKAKAKERPDDDV